MNTLQLSPISGTSATAAGASPAGEAVASPNPKPTQPPQPVAASAAQAAQASRVHAEQTAAAAEADQRITTPSLNLNVGLVRGTFDVYVDLTDTTNNRVVARVYGPRGNTPELKLTASKVRTEA